jgi:hypothetical protein
LAQSDANQLEGFLLFCRANDLIDEVQRHDWAGFARRFNGPIYQQRQYDTRIAAAYARISAELADRYNSVLPNGERAPALQAPVVPDPIPVADD